MDSLGRYYTNNIISSLLIKNIEIKSPKKILDLGLGDASLTLAAFQRWGNAEFFATEIENKLNYVSDKKFDFVRIFNLDSLNPELSNILQPQLGVVDIAICNPPYIKVENKHSYDELFKSIGCEDFTKLRYINSEIVFFAQNLRLLRDKGELAIIVSDSLITGKDFSIFRSVILNKFKVNRIIQLPDKIFDKTEARTHIVFISKKLCDSKLCELSLAKMDGSIEESLFVSKFDLVSRMDFQFHKYQQSNIIAHSTLKDIGGQISRGRFTAKELSKKRITYFHSIHYKKLGSFLDFESLEEDIDDKFVAKMGDILICRVGKRVVGSVAIVRKGKVVISDCIFRVRVSKRYQKPLFDSLLSPDGKKWLNAYSHGVCSLVLSKSDLENFPLFSLE